MAREVQLGLQHRGDLIRIVPETADTEKRTVELTWTTGARVRRRSFFDGTFDEELSLEDGAVRLGRLNEGAPFLNAHAAYDLGGVIGVVERAWIEGEGAQRKGRAVVRMSDRADVEPIWQDIRNKIIRNVSVGYAVRKYQIEKKEGQVPIYRAVDWEPMEISAVPVGADAGAGFRGAGDDVSTCILEGDDETMAGTATGAAAAAQDDATRNAAAAAATEETARQAREAEQRTQLDKAVSDERARQADIRRRCRGVGLPESFADDLVGRGVTLDQAATVIVDELAARGGKATLPRIEGGADHTDPTVRREQMAGSLAARFAPQYVKAPAGGDRYRGWSVLDMAADICQISGRMSRDAMARAALASTSDFPLILESTLNKVLEASYAVRPPTYRTWAAQRTFRDFRAHNFYRAGDFPDLVINGENEEIQYGSAGEEKESVTAYKYARIFGLSREMIINDDLGAFVEVFSMAGRRVADKENALVYGVLNLNSGAGPALRDTAYVFTTGRGNKAGTGSTIDLANVALARAAMLSQKSIDGIALNLMPNRVVCGPAYEQVALSFFMVPIQPIADSAANPYKGTTEVTVDGNITTNHWYMFAEPGAAPVMIYGWVDGYVGPQVDMKEGWSTDAVEYRVRDYFGCGAIDWRGGYFNAGA